MVKQITLLTEQLFEYNCLFLKLYKETREKQEQKDFYTIVKPFADEVKIVNDNWSKYLKEWLKGNSKQHLHIQQVDSIYEHIERLSIQAFYPKTSKSKFLNSQRTVDYFLSELLIELKK